MNEEDQKPGKKQAPLKSFFTVFFFLISLAVSAQTTEVLCKDGIDNDGDGKIDCLDGDCVFAASIEAGCNCYDGLDNDSDGKIDQADNNCAPYFGLTFVGSGSNCSIVPPGANTPFDLIGPPAESSQNTADTQSKVAVGDVDGNGVPDAVITSKWNSEVRIIASRASTGIAALGAPTLKAGDVVADFRLTGAGITTQFDGIGCGTSKNLLFEHEVLIGDIDKNGRAEIYAVVSNRLGNPDSPPDNFYLVGLRLNAYGAQGLQLIPGFPVCLGTNRPGIFGIADMDGDGKAEIYLRDRIFAAENGKLLASEGAKLMNNTAQWDIDVSSAPVTVDVKAAGADGSVMELIVGPKIYKVPSLTNRTPASPGALTLWRDMNTLTFDIDGNGTSDQYFVKLMTDLVEYGVDTHSATSIADVDKDGHIDVVITGALNSSVGRTTIFYWNVQKNTVSGFRTLTSADLGYAPGTEPTGKCPTGPSYTNYQNGWIWGAGRVNIGDANGDGKLDFSFIAGSHLYCVTTNAPGTNIVPLWASPRTINDSRSGVLTVTIYDFDNDGKPEMIYRDSQELVVIDGSTGTVKHWSAICESHTYTEGPVIADVNGDGATDICVTCATAKFDVCDGIQQQALGQVRLYFSNGNEWLPTRKVWNQPGYHVVNINDNLTLPFPQMDPALVFSNAPCPNGTPGPQTPLNVFLNQVPFLSADGCPVFPAPDLSFTGDDPDRPGVDTDGDGVVVPAVQVIPPICGNLDIKAIFRVLNDGDLPITATVPVSFFIGDPTKPTIKPDSLIHTTTLNIVNLQVGATYVSPTVTFNGSGKPFRLYIVLNNNGSVLPINPLAKAINECRLDNNIYDVFIQPDPFSGVIQKIKDNDKCVAADPNVGELRARIFKGDPTIPANEVVDYSSYTFQWYYGTGTASPVPAALGGTNYTISALPEGSYTLVVTNTQKGCTTLPVTSTIVLNTVLPAVTINVLSDQTNCVPPNGSLEAVVAGGNTGFTFQWFNNAAPMGISTATATNLIGSNYTVAVSRNGCTTTATEVVDDLAFEPDVTATSTPVVDCSNLLSGTVSAQASLGGVPQSEADYNFNWYFHNIGTGTRGSVLPPGNGTGPNRTALAAGYYEVEAVSKATLCKSLPFVIEVKALPVVPTVVISQLTTQTSCDPNSPNGRLQATAFIGGVAQNPSSFTFQWFVGQNTLPANLHTSVSGTNGSIAEAVKGGGQSYTVKATTALNCFGTDDEVVLEDINIPVVTLTPGPNGICDPAIAGVSFNGTMLANVTFDGVTVTDFTNYKFTWYNGSVVTATPRAETTRTLSGLNTGYYTVVAERTDLKCVGLAESEFVDDATVLPTITAIPSPSTNCDPALVNGQINVTNVVSGATSGTGAPFTFQWYTGSVVNPGAIMSGETGPLLDQQQGSFNGVQTFRTVLVTNTLDGCRNTDTKEIQDNRKIPLLSMGQTPNGVCDPALIVPIGPSYNGTATGNVSNQAVYAVPTFTYVWTNNATSTTIPGATGATASNLKEGLYSTVVKHVPTGCESAPGTIQVLPDKDPVVITASAINSTNCLPLVTANGEMEVTNVVSGAVSGTGAPFRYEWYTGSAVVPGNMIAGETGPLLDQQQGGVNNDVFFTVRVVNTSDGCESTDTKEIKDAHVTPLLAMGQTPNGICDPALVIPATTLFSGTATGTVSNSAAFAPQPQVFTYEWTNSATSAVIAGATGATASNLKEGSYTTVATHTASGCKSAPGVIVVLPDKDPVVITTTANPSTNCLPLGTANGEMEVTNVVSGVISGTGAPFRYEWYDKDGNLIPGETGTLLDQRQGDVGAFFTARVINTQDGCESTDTKEIQDKHAKPSFTLTSTPNTFCDPSLIVPAGAPGSGTASEAPLSYTFDDTYYTGPQTLTYAWFDGEYGVDNIPPASLPAHLPGTTTNSITRLAAGFYTATVTITELGCTSDPVSVEVEDDLFIPVIDIAPTNQTSCDATAPNGILAATIDETLDGGVPGENSADYNFDWFNTGNPSTLPGVAVTTTTTTNGEVDQLVGNVYYKVDVRRVSTGCENSEVIFLPEVLVTPVVTLGGMVPQSACDVPNGSLTATVTPSFTTTYSYYWLRENAGTTTTDADAIIAAVTASPADPNNLTTVNSNTHINGGLVYGRYSVVVVDDFNNCVSDPKFEDIVDNTQSDIDITGFGLPPSSCTTDGALQMKAQRLFTPPVATSFNFDVFRGGPVNTVLPIDYYSTPPNPPTFAGAVLQSLVAIPNNTFKETTVAGINSDLYTVVAEDNFGCKTYKSFFLPFANSHDVDFTVTDVTSCVVDNGAIRMKAIFPAATIPPNIGEDNNQTNYSFTYRNADMSPVGGTAFTNGYGAAVTNAYSYPASIEKCNTPALDEDGDTKLDAADEDCIGSMTASSLPVGFYVLEVLDLTSLCPVYKPVEVKQIAISPVISLDGTIDVNTACDILAEADGEFAFRIDKDPAEPAIPGVTYSYVVDDPAGSNDAGLAGGVAIAPISNLPPGTYTVLATASTGCDVSKEFVVNDVPTVSELVDGNIKVIDAEYCDATMEASAKIEVETVNLVNGGGADDLTDYDFEWYADASLTSPIAVTAANVPILLNGANGVAAGVVTIGDYYVVSKKARNAGGSGGVGCFSAPFQAIVGDKTSNPSVTLHPFMDTSCETTGSNFEGALEIEVVTSPPGADPDYTYPGSVTDFDYTWFSGGLPATDNNNGNRSNDAGADDDRIDLLDPDTYGIVVKSAVTGCTATHTTTITKLSVPVIITNATAFDQVICNPDGSIVVNQVKVGNDPPPPLPPIPPYGPGDPEFADFEFTWYKDDPNGLPLFPVDPLNRTNNVLDIIDLPTTMGAGVYYVKATRFNGAPGAGCTSAPLRKEVVDVHINPTATLVPTNDTSCEQALGGSFEGTLTLTVTSNGSGPAPANYQLDWVTSGNNFTTPANSTVAVASLPLTILNRSDDTYSVKVRNEASNCYVDVGTTITKLSVPIIITNADKDDQNLCDPSGSITVERIEVGAVTYNYNSGIPAPDPGFLDFEFTWSKDLPSPPALPIVPFTPGNNNNVLDATDLPTTMGAGIYYVKATRFQGSPGAGCTSAPLRMDVLDTHVNPTITLTPTNDTSCETVSDFEGSLRVQVTSAGSLPSPTFSYRWDPTNPSPAADRLTIASTDETFTGLIGDLTNDYSLTVENDATGCIITAAAKIQKVTIPIIIANASTIDQLICNPDGSFSVDRVDVGPLSYTNVNAEFADFQYAWYKNDPILNTELVPIAAGNNVLDVTDLPTSMGAGTYYVTAERFTGSPGSGCISAPLRKEILDLSVDPDMSFTPTPNSSCTGGTPNGEIVAVAVERDGSTETYTFAWTLNSGALNPSTIITDATPQSTLTDAIDGKYALQVTNTVTGCRFTKDMNLVLDQSMSLPNIVDVSAFDPFDCYPTGSARVVEITIGGVTTITNPAQLDADFDYEWYKNAFPANLLAGQINAALPNQLPDNYFVLVRDLLTNCKSSPVEVVISDADIVYPVVNIVQTRPQISCDPAIGTAELMATGDGQDDTNVNYSFDWFPSLDATGVSFATTSTISNLVAGDYSVTVLNAATNCAASAPFIVPNAAPQFLPQLSISTTERTRCDAEDGALFASGVPFPIDPTQVLNNYPFPYNYTAELYAGDPPADINTPEFGFMSNDPSFPTFTSNFLRANLADGVYTVRLTDLNTGCVTIDAARVEDGRILPVVTIVEDSPLINCDVTRPNGQLSATADGGKIAGYSFEWFSGTAPSGTSISTINKLIAQTMGSYTVLVRNNITGCEQDETGQVSDGRLFPPTPNVTLVRGRTNCDFPNGWVSVDVGGVTLGYEFNWYDDPSNTSGSPDETGTDYIDLDVENYGATATDLITGCISPVGIIQVPDLRIIPQVTLTSTPSFCLNPTGSVLLELNNSGEVVLTDIRWIDSVTTAPIGIGSALYDLPAGFYRADFVTSEGCENGKTVEVKTEILSYNLVSANSDNSNDFWNIDCIQNFPSNNVKVFNRSGVKVYEADGYNNADVVFRGIGEKGVYSLGNDLPDGTYFYVIDKRDGSKPVVGYLELVH